MPETGESNARAARRVSARDGALLCVLALLLAAPFALRPAREAAPAGALRLVALSPHNEAIRYEFGRAFSRWHQVRYGAPVVVDWRNLGGTSEIVRYIDGEFEAARRAGRKGIGVDLLFGGGQYDHARQAVKGNTEPCGIRDRHPEWLEPDVMPAVFTGERYRDESDRWYGCCLSSFGICYNMEALADAGIAAPPRRWSDLARFEYFGRIVLADPTKSGSINKAFEMLIQQQIAEELRERGCDPAQARVDDIAAGWRRAMALLRRIGANARYYTDSAGKVVVDVAQGNAVAGMCIDFYGRFESEIVLRRESSDRMRYVSPEGGTSVSVDPVSVLAGAPSRELASRFVEFVLSEDGQKLWNYRVGEPGGPVRYALRRLPVRRDMYSAEHRARMSDPEVMPYDDAAGFEYRSEWTGHLFSLIRMLVRAMCIDPHEELSRAWLAVNRAGGPAVCPQAMAALDTLPANAEYGAAAETAERCRDKLEEARIARQWAIFFKASYEEAMTLAQIEVSLAGREAAQ